MQLLFEMNALKCQEPSPILMQMSTCAYLISFFFFVSSSLEKSTGKPGNELEAKVVTVAYVKDWLKIKWMPLGTADETSCGEIVQGEWQRLGA